MSRPFAQAPIDFRSMAPGVKWLLLANTAVFVIRAVVNGSLHMGDFDLLFGLVPNHLLLDRYIWQPFTYLFLHDGFFNLLFNLFSIWMFGMPVEAQWGTREFLKFFLLCGLGTAAAAVALGPLSKAPVIGAAGPVFGLLVAFAMLYPESVVYLYFLFPVTARQMAVIFGVIEVFGLIAAPGEGPARFAPLAGAAAGYVYIRWWWLIKVRAKAWLKGAGPRPAPLAASRAGRKASRSGEPPPASMDDVDRILDKILAQGIGSLSDEEKAIMKRYSERNKP